MGQRAFDLVLVGGGLANSLIAYRLAQLQPKLTVLVLEAGETFGGNHTWSFHESDLTPAQRTWTAPFVAHRWPFYTVVFPDLHRRVDLAYCSVTSERLHATLADAGIAVRFGTCADRVSPRDVRLSTGETVSAEVVIDGRGFVDTPHLRLGWQKFVGQELRLAHPHRLGGPILMDATVQQHDGYRFVYVLPFAPDRLLVEDTYYSNRSDLDVLVLKDRIGSYARDKGWVTAEVMREEAGVLPITLAGDNAAFWADRQGQPSSGLRAGLFHPTTGFSWLEAVRLADHLAGLDGWEAGAVHASIRKLAALRWRNQAFFRGLNRMLFCAGDPARRWVMMQRFYKFSEQAISRFYAGELSGVDKMQLLMGRPPVSIAGAVRALIDRNVRAA